MNLSHSKRIKDRRRRDHAAAQQQQNDLAFWQGNVTRMHRDIFLMIRQLTGVHYSNYFNMLEAINGNPVWCHNCHSKGINIVAAMEKDMAGGVLRHATGQPPSDTRK